MINKIVENATLIKKVSLGLIGGLTATTAAVSIVKLNTPNPRFVIEGLGMYFKTNAEAEAYINNDFNYEKRENDMFWYALSGVGDSNIDIGEVGSSEGLYGSFAEKLNSSLASKYISINDSRKTSSNFWDSKYWTGTTVTDPLIDEITAYYAGMKSINSVLTEAPFTSLEDVARSISTNNVKITYNGNDYTSFDDAVAAVMRINSITVESSIIYGVNDSLFTYSDGSREAINIDTDFTSKSDAIAGVKAFVSNVEKGKKQNISITFTENDYLNGVSDVTGSVNNFETAYDTWTKKPGNVASSMSVNALDLTIPNNTTYLNHPISTIKGQIFDRRPFWMDGNVYHAGSNRKMIDPVKGMAGSELLASWKQLSTELLTKLQCDGDFVKTTPSTDGTDWGYGANKVAPLSAKGTSGTASDTISWYDHLKELIELYKVEDFLVRDDFSRSKAYENIPCVNGVPSFDELDTYFYSADALPGVENRTFFERIINGYSLGNTPKSTKEYRQTSDYTSRYNAWLKEPTRTGLFRWNDKVYSNNDLTSFNAALNTFVNASVTDRYIAFLTKFFVKNYPEASDIIGPNKFHNTLDAANSLLKDEIIKWKPWTEEGGYIINSGNIYDISNNNLLSLESIVTLIENSNRFEIRYSKPGIITADPDTKWSDVVAYSDKKVLHGLNFNGAGTDYVFEEFDRYSTEAMLIAGFAGLGWQRVLSGNGAEFIYAINGEIVPDSGIIGVVSRPTYFISLEAAKEYWLEKIQSA